MAGEAPCTACLLVHCVCPCLPHVSACLHLSLCCAAPLTLTPRCTPCLGGLSGWLLLPLLLLLQVHPQECSGGDVQG